ncbi:cytochrome c biogenesis heme-transporting ATPase CcmA [Maribrevibacterium harenarium]|uniref:Cytochrome c biogenesis heme-transporting ATPase CcmA n=1 Tax=Maribrevibacterium harenarium TaxID=2589817 RepID=A0A501X2L4_9GAMM|nr:cytochrome c biogenesis heme-transporting ATPase CcmA [Maribrevibacterium harenarium]TPE54728.1 cytochrome c biogenesis heme-transporting ATPase CcmA [Maribrevibacterium harenarium]
MQAVTTLCVENLWLERGDRDLCRGLSFSLQGGQVARIIGENGAGKSSLLKYLVGTLSAVEGSVAFNGEDISAHRDVLIQDLLYIGHTPGVKSVFTVAENLKLYAPHSSNQELEYALTQVSLDAYWDTPAAQLSAGQKRRVALARLWLTQKPVWLLDEPFTALDVSGVEVLEQRIKDHVITGGIVVLTTHQPLHSLNPVTIELAS